MLLFPFLKGRFKSGRFAAACRAPACQFPFLKGRFKSGVGGSSRSGLTRFHSSKEDSRDSSPRAARRSMRCFHSSKEDSRGGRGRSQPTPFRSFPFLKGRFKRRRRWIERWRGRLSFHSSKEDSRAAGMEGGRHEDPPFPFLKGRFKSIFDLPFRRLTAGFHSSKEDSREFPN